MKFCSAAIQMTGLHRRTYLMHWMQNFISHQTRVQVNRIISVTGISLKKITGYCMIGGGESVFCNPPYGKEMYKWVEKCYFEGRKEHTTVVLLIPARTDTKYFHDFIIHRTEIRFIKGRLKFGNSKNAAPFPSMLVIFRGAKV